MLTRVLGGIGPEGGRLTAAGRPSWSSTSNAEQLRLNIVLRHLRIECANNKSFNNKGLSLPLIKTNMSGRYFLMELPLQQIMQFPMERKSHVYLAVVLLCHAGPEARRIPSQGFRAPGAACPRARTPCCRGGIRRPSVVRRCPGRCAGEVGTICLDIGCEADVPRMAVHTALRSDGVCSGTSWGGEHAPRMLSTQRVWLGQ